MEGETLKRAWGELLCSHTHKPHTKAHESFIPFPQNFTCGISSKHPSLVSPPPFPRLVRGIIQTKPCEPSTTRSHLRSSSTTPHRASTSRHHIFIVRTLITTTRFVPPDSTQRRVYSWWRIYKFLQADHRSNNDRKVLVVHMWFEDARDQFTRS